MDAARRQQHFLVLTIALEDVLSRFLLVIGLVVLFPSTSKAQLRELRQTIFGMD